MSILPNLLYRFNSIIVKVSEHYRYGQTDSKVYMERQEIQSRQLNIEGKEQCWKTDTTLLQYLL